MGSSPTARTYRLVTEFRRKRWEGHTRESGAMAEATQTIRVGSIPTARFHILIGNYQTA